MAEIAVPHLDDAKQFVHEFHDYLREETDLSYGRRNTLRQAVHDAFVEEKDPADITDIGAALDHVKAYKERRETLHDADDEGDTDN